MSFGIGCVKSDLGKYYTRENVSELLISLLSVEDPKTVLDLGSGDGSLTKAAAKRWYGANFITVDIDFDTKIDNPQLSPEQLFHTHHKADALCPNLINSIGLNHGVVDVALCNPPFIKPNWSEYHLNFLKKAGFNDIYPGVESISAEVIFIIQNLLSLKDGGQLGLILPDGFVSGERNKSFRNYILQNNSIERVIKLPRNAFIGTDVSAHIVIITKGKKSQKVILSNLAELGFPKKDIEIDLSQAVVSLNYDYYKYEREVDITACTPLKLLGAKARRGSYSSVDCKGEMTGKVFHITDFKPGYDKIDLIAWETDEELYPNRTRAVKGDIVIGRIGRNIVNKINFVDNGTALISDCVIKLSIPERYAKSVFEYLVSDDGLKAISSRISGAGANHLTISKLLEIRIPNIVLGIKND